MTETEFYFSFKDKKSILKLDDDLTKGYGYKIVTVEKDMFQLLITNYQTSRDSSPPLINYY